MALRVLALHGFGQNAAVFVEKRTKELARKLKQQVIFTALDAPHVLPFDPTLRGWWSYGPELWDGRAETIQALAEQLLDSGEFQAQGFWESCEFVLKEWEAGNYDGILGFSQGAILVAALCCEMQRRNLAPPRFAVLIAGFGRPVPSGVEAYPPKAPLKLPSLHIWGRGDDHIPGWASELMLEYFENPKVYTHEGGHFVPQKAPDVDAIREFLAPFMKEGAAVANGGKNGGSGTSKGGAKAPPVAAAAPKKQGSSKPAIAQASPASPAPHVGGRAERKASTPPMSAQFEELSGPLAAYKSNGSSPPATGSTDTAQRQDAASGPASHTNTGEAYIEAELLPPGPGTYERLLGHLRQHNVDFKLLGPHPPCRTSEEAMQVRLDAGWQGVTLASGAKAMMLRAPGVEENWVLAVLPADRKLSWKKIRAIKGKATRMATEEEVFRVAGCLPGSVPPITKAFPVPTECVVDATIPSIINFNCGLKTRSISMSKEDYLRVEEPSVWDIVD